jgi:hypothetical protein
MGPLPTNKGGSLIRAAIGSVEGGDLDMVKSG